jgi:hypothetical protein
MYFESYRYPPGRLRECGCELEPRKQTFSVVTVNGYRQLGAKSEIGRLIDSGPDRLRVVIRSEHDVIRLREFQQRIHRRLRARMGDIHIKLLELRNHSVRNVLVVLRVMWITVLYPLGKDGHRSGGMRNDELDLGVPMQDALRQKTSASARRIEVVFVHRRDRVQRSGRGRWEQSSRRR